MRELSLPPLGPRSLRFAVLVAGLAGCANSAVQTDDQGRHHVTCDYSGALACHRAAKAHCGKAGYQVLSEVTDAGSQAGGPDVSLITVRERVRILTFDCKDS